MAFVNYNNKEITVKIVYYGPALSGKTTCLKHIYTSKKFKKKGKLITLDTDGDRTLFFDFLPIEIGKLGDYQIKMQLYTVPGQVSYDTTRKLVLQGADGIVFVADSQVVMADQNIESFENLKVNLELNNISYAEIPIIIQYNKRDLREILPLDDLNKEINPENRPSFPTVATNGENVIESLHAIMKMVIIYLKNRLSIFQKDKTVMFSRDDITTTQGKLADSDYDLYKEDTEKEEVIELSSPMTETGSGGDDEIFDLDDENMVENESEPPGENEDDDDLLLTDDSEMVLTSDDEIDLDEHPEISISDEDHLVSSNVVLQDDLLDDVPPESQETGPQDEDVFNIEEEVPVSVVDNAKQIEVPINIEIPQGKDEVRINLSLKIVLKKK